MVALDWRIERSWRSWNNAETRHCSLRVVNRSEAAIDVLWVTWEGEEARYAVLQPDTAYNQPTYSTHVWRLRDYHSRALLMEHVAGDMAGDTTLVIEPCGQWKRCWRDS
mmetsp:Transcript_18498/g.55787  ORF Transcript_18498/g.55787 Transcript_18498/m.55787 type:complete len:109 (+) Transcript_18498:45-371(+)